MAGLFGKSLVTTGSNASGVPPCQRELAPGGEREREDSWMRTVLTDVTPVPSLSVNYSTLVSPVIREW